MRRIFLGLGPVVAGVILFACEDSSSPQASDPFEAGSFDGGPISEGGPQPDGSADAADAAQSKSVTIDVLRGGVPEAGVMVVFHDAAGSFLETKTTGADGKATSTPGMTPSQASALLGGGNLRRIFTWTSVTLGEELFVNDVAPRASSGTFSITLQGTFSDGGAAGANALIGSCGGNAAGTNVLVDLDPGCARPTSSVLARALNQSFDTILAYAFKKTNAAPLDGGTANASVGPWLAPAKVSVTPKNLPAPNTFSGLFAGLSEISEGLAFRNEYGGAVGRLGVAAFDATPAGFAEAYQTIVRFSINAAPGSTLLVGKRAAPAANTDLDLSTALPALNGATLEASEVRRPQLDWTTLGGASLAATDGGTIAIRWSGDTRVEDLAWTFIVAPGAATVKAPAMPPAADAWLPHAANDAGAASSFGIPEVTFVESDLLPGYTEFRRDIGRILPLSDTSGRDSRAVLPANGSLRATSFYDVPL